MAETPNGVERGIERGTAHSVIDDVEAAPARVIADILLRGRLLPGRLPLRPVARYGPLRSFVDREDLGSKSPSDLDRNAPTPPAPRTSTFWRAWTCARSTKPSQAVIKTRGSAAASRMLRLDGFGARRSASTAANFASEP